MFPSKLTLSGSTGMGGREVSDPTIGALFADEPGFWGLRGDPYLWQEMRERLSLVALPASEADLVSSIEREFASITGHTLKDKNDFYVERFYHGGMSGGYISGEFWVAVALPMLVQRYRCM